MDGRDSFAGIHRDQMKGREMNIYVDVPYKKKGREMEGDEKKAVVGKEGADELAESLADLFTNITIMVQGELQGTGNTLELLERMNRRVAEEYGGFGDVTSGLRIYIEQINKKNGSFEEFLQQIDAIDHQVTEFEAALAMLDKYVSLLEQKVYNAPHSARS